MLSSAMPDAAAGEVSVSEVGTPPHAVPTEASAAMKPMMRMELLERVECDMSSSRVGVCVHS